MATCFGQAYGKVSLDLHQASGVRRSTLFAPALTTEPSPPHSARQLEGYEGGLRASRHGVELITFSPSRQPTSLRLSTRSPTSPRSCGG